MAGILTGQYVQIEQPAASAGDRVVAQLIDWFFQLSYIVLMVWVLKMNDDVETFFFIVVLPVMLYPLFMEQFNHGQTLGKQIRGLRVVMLDGASPTLGALFLRWLLIIVDGPLLLYAGLLAIILTRNHQRLGDLAAGTVVIRLQSYERSRISLDDYAYLSSGYRPRYAAAAELSLEQADLIRRALDTDNEQRIDLLAAKVEQTLGIRRRETYTDLFLQMVLRDYQYYALEQSV